MKKFIPALGWLANYKKADLAGDLTAGLTVGVMLIPQGMAYSMLAGLPAIYGLYACTLPLIVYALLGTSRQLAVGPVAMVALLISSGVGQLAELGSVEFVGLAILLALMVGAIQLAMGVFRLGFVVNFLSHPVIAGFTSAAALIIGFSQLKHLLGINIPRGKVHETLLNVYENFNQIHLPTFTLGALAIAILWAIKKWKLKKIPGPLIVVLLGIGAVVGLGLADPALGTNIVKVVGEVPGGLPAFSLPSWSWGSMEVLLPTALAISFIGFMESIAVAKAIQKKHKDYELDNNQELIALGAANILGSFFQSFPVTGGFSRTAVNDQAGARTGLASIISALLIVVTLLFLTSYFYYLPNAILSAIIMVAVFGLIDIKEAQHLWATDRRDFVLFMVTFIGTLSLGIEEGILIGVLLSLLLVIYQVSYPHIAILGKVENMDIYRNVNRFDDAEELDGILIIRFDARLYFANSQYFKDFVLKALEQRQGVQHLVLDAESINGLDSSAVHVLHDIIHELGQRGIQFYLADVKGPVRDRLKKAQLLDEISPSHIYNTIQETVDAIQQQKDFSDTKKYAVQTGKRHKP